MKRTLALLTTLMLLVSAAVLPATAEETAGTTDSVATATISTGRGGRNNRLQTPGNGQLPQQPGQDNQNGQLPQQPGQDNQNGQNGQQFRMPGQGGRKGGGLSGRTGKAGKNMIFDLLLKEGVITQEVYDAIMAYLKTIDPQAQTGADATAEGAAVPAAPGETAPAEGTEPPALPDGSEAPARPDGAQNEPDGADGLLKELKELLDKGVITQEVYDLLLNMLTQAQPADSTT